jgi:hypothetical protein
MRHSVLEIFLRIGSLRYGERFMYGQFMTTRDALAIQRDDRRTCVSGDPYRSWWKCCLLTEKHDADTILEEISIRHDDRRFALHHRLNRPAHA